MSQYYIYYPVDPHRAVGAQIATHGVVFKVLDDNRTVRATVSVWERSNWQKIPMRDLEQLKESGEHWGWLGVLRDPDAKEPCITREIGIRTARLLWKKMTALGWDYCAEGQERYKHK